LPSKPDFLQFYQIVQKQKGNGDGDAAASRKKQSVNFSMRKWSRGFKKNISGRIAKSKDNRTTFIATAPKNRIWFLRSSCQNIRALSPNSCAKGQESGKVVTCCGFSAEGALFRFHEKLRPTFKSINPDLILRALSECYCMLQG
jgi:hypothetical protein